MAYDSSLPANGGNPVAADIRENFRAVIEDGIVEFSGSSGDIGDITVTPTQINDKCGASASGTQIDHACNGLNVSVVSELTNSVNGLNATAAQINTACYGSTAKNSHAHYTQAVEGLQIPFATYGSSPSDAYITVIFVPPSATTAYYYFQLATSYGSNQAYARFVVGSVNGTTESTYSTSYTPKSGNFSIGSESSWTTLYFQIWNGSGIRQSAAQYGTLYFR